MKTILSAALAAALLALSACGDEPAQTGAATPVAPATTTTTTTAPAPAVTSTTRTETQEALDAIRDAGRQTGEAAGAAASDLRDAAAPALDRARAAGSEALDSAQQGLNNLTRSAACQTARGANDAEGIAANC